MSPRLRLRLVLVLALAFPFPLSLSMPEVAVPLHLPDEADSNLTPEEKLGICDAGSQLYFEDGWTPGPNAIKLLGGVTS
jgi:hypothetical protein